MDQKPPPQPPRQAEPQRFSDHLLEYARDSTLWPVLLVAIGIFATIGTAVLIAALRKRNPFAVLALLVLLGLTADVAYRELRSGGFGPISGGLLLLWGLSAAGALTAIGLGWS